MTAERWAQIKELFEAALEQPAADRETFVCTRSNDDAWLCDETLAMLRNNEKADGLLYNGMQAREWVLPAAAARTLNPGEILAGRYRIVRPIGAGGMGEVYEAEDLDLGAQVAVKTMRIEDPAALVQFKREIQLARTVTHPNVCRIFDLHRHHEPQSGRVVTFLTMELVKGETLAQYLAKSGALSAERALPIIRQVGAALSAAHDCQVVHRDLKPGNVILTADGARVVVTDFGLAYPLAQVTASTVTITGTPAYMAPEQFEGKLVTAAADIYAFGVLLYEMVVGRRPFEGESPIALALEKIGKEAPSASEAVPSLPPGWSAVIRRCLQARPERRFSNVSEAMSTLEYSVSRRPFIRLSRRQKQLTAASAFLCALVAFSAWRYTQSTYSPGRELLRLYRLGVHTQQIGLPWKASQLFEQAVERDQQFAMARVHLAEAWMDLDQPGRAQTELQKAAALRPRWRRVALHDALLEQAANAQLRGDLSGSAALHVRVTAAAPEAERPDALLSEARAKSRAGDFTGAIKSLAGMVNAVPCQGAAMLAHAVLVYFRQPVLNTRRFEQTANCFEAAGDLDGVAQSWFEFARPYPLGGPPEMLAHLRQSSAISHANGNIEQQISTAAFLSELMLETGDDEAAFNSFSEAMQLAARHDLRFLSAGLLNQHAEYFFAKGDYLQASHFGGSALILSRSEAMPWTFARCSIREATLSLRMSLPDQALKILRESKEKLQKYPNAALSAEVSQLIEKAKHTPSRPEGSVYVEQR